VKTEPIEKFLLLKLSSILTFRTVRLDIFLAVCFFARWKRASLL
jgi:hypothetical protein